ncbi:hypothetical protein AXE65_00030 [Ventosimonas gracilis]|uniref:Uncharacterized protein n=1 Tax=Ventosimonas gracilis TaxID=1680762 RepID=A0A139SVU6_9GAMM|nr:hypothetical protein [Ventosimonas gracilis]KXU38590.1 hypothetical protein AXE65_00030 [Ventosimonas gracilis]
MLFWLIPLVLLILLSPLLWLLPKKQQGERMQLRLAARRMGLGMQLVSENWPHWMAHAQSPCAQYQLPHKKAGADWRYWQDAQGQWQNQWREPCADKQLLPLLQQLPVDVYKIASDKQIITLYWGERGGFEALKTIAAVLERLTAAEY